jgi:hypothetical protein
LAWENTENRTGNGTMGNGGLGIEGSENAIIAMQHKRLLRQARSQLPHFIFSRTALRQQKFNSLGRRRKTTNISV